MNNLTFFLIGLVLCGFAIFVFWFFKKPIKPSYYNFKEKDRREILNERQ